MINASNRSDQIRSESDQSEFDQIWSEFGLILK